MNPTSTIPHQPSPINPSPIPNPPTFPARPINGGDLTKVREKFGEWFFEPKYNGWRTLFHAQTGAMFNRLGQRLTIEPEFAAPLAGLRQACSGYTVEWVDCEALERRHDIGRGTLIVLDWLWSVENHKSRRWRIKEQLDLPTLGYEAIPRPHALYMAPSFVAGDAPQVWADLQLMNQRLRCPF